MLGVSQAELDQSLQEDAEGAFADADRVPSDRLPRDAQDFSAFDRQWGAHCVDFVNECVKESFESTKQRREFDEELWRAHENDIREFADKEAWQSKIVLNMPFRTATQATSIVRRGMVERPDYFSITPDDPQNLVEALQADFWTQALRYFTNLDEAKLQYDVCDAARVGFAVGQSQCIKCLWRPDHTGTFGLVLERFYPWKQYDDPGRRPRRPWSGLYNLHEEWMDYHDLWAGQEAGYYRNIDAIDFASQPSDSAALWRHSIEEQREEERRKSGMASMRNKYRKNLLVREFWGSVLDSHGKMLFPNVTYTVAGSQIIRGPFAIPFPRPMRWPWMDIVPLPHPNRYHGYGLYEGVMAIWKMQSQLLNLYLDNENFRINNMYELFPDLLRNPADDDIFPGKKFLRKAGSEASARAVLPVPKGDSNLADVSFMWNLGSNEWQEGSFVTKPIMGIAGQRAETATQRVQDTQQALGVFDSIGRDVEDGIVNTIKCVQMFLQTFWFEINEAPFRKLLTTNPIAQQINQGLMPDDRMKVMTLNSRIKVQGVSKAFQKQTIIQQLTGLAQMATNPLFTQYIKAYLLVKKYADELGEGDLVLSEEEVAQLQQVQQLIARKQALQQAHDQALEAAGLKSPTPPGTSGGPSAKPATAPGQPAHPITHPPTTPQTPHQQMGMA